jgi:hypothetical protein
VKKGYARTSKASREAELRHWQPEEGWYMRGRDGYMRDEEGVRVTK